MSTVPPQRAHIRNIGRVSVRLVPGAKDARILIAQQEKRSGNKGKLEVKPREIWGSIIHSFGSRWACLTGCKGETSLGRLRLREMKTHLLVDDIFPLQESTACLQSFLILPQLCI